MTFRHKKRAPIKKGVFLWEKGAHKFRCVCLRTANKHKCSVRRNGRRTGLKIPRWQHRVGSTPTTSTIGENGIFACFRFFLKSKNYALTFVFASRDQTQLLFHYELVATYCNEANTEKIIFEPLRRWRSVFSIHKNAKAFIVSLH